MGRLLSRRLRIPDLALGELEARYREEDYLVGAWAS